MSAKFVKHLSNICQTFVKHVNSMDVVNKLSTRHVERIFAQLDAVKDLSTNGQTHVSTREICQLHLSNICQILVKHLSDKCQLDRFCQTSIKHLSPSVNSTCQEHICQRIVKYICQLEKYVSQTWQIFVKSLSNVSSIYFATHLSNIYQTPNVCRLDRFGKRNNNVSTRLIWQMFVVCFRVTNRFDIY
jgi:hypothetical protein